jgi:hypothetical protein
LISVHLIESFSRKKPSIIFNSKNLLNIVVVFIMRNVNVDAVTRVVIESLIFENVEIMQQNVVFRR